MMRNKNYLFIWSFLGLVLSFILPDFAMGMKGYQAYYFVTIKWDFFFLNGSIAAFVVANAYLPYLVLPFFLYRYSIRKMHLVEPKNRRIWNLVFLIFWLAPFLMAPLIYWLAIGRSPVETFEWGYALSAFFMLVLYISYVKLNPQKEQDELGKHLVDEL